MRLRGKMHVLGYSERLASNGRTYRNLDVYGDGEAAQLSVPDELAETASKIAPMTECMVEVDVVKFNNGGTMLRVASISPNGQGRG